MVFDDFDIIVVYMLIDGKLDISIFMVLKEVFEMNVDRKIFINIIFFNCLDRFFLLLVKFNIFFFIIRKVNFLILLI